VKVFPRKRVFNVRDDDQGVVALDLGFNKGGKVPVAGNEKVNLMVDQSYL